MTARVGTSYCLAPELHHIKASQLRYNHKVDMLSLGWTLYEIGEECHGSILFRTIVNQPLFIVPLIDCVLF